MAPIYSGDLSVAPENEGISTLGTSLGERFQASVAETVQNLPLISSFRSAEEDIAGGQTPSWSDPEAIMQEQIAQDSRPPIPETSIDDAKARVKAAKLDQSITLPDQGTIKTPVLDLMIEHAREQRERQTTITRGPQGFIPGALDVGTSFLVGALDPVNVAAFSIPVLGEARYAKLLESVGENVFGRAGVRVGVGALQGGVGSIALTPVDYLAHTQDGQDYTMSQALENIIMGAGTGGLMHSTGFPLNIRGGVFGEAYRSIRGRPLDLPTEAPTAPVKPAHENVPAGASVETTVPDSHEAAERTVWENAQAEHNAVVGSELMASVADLPPRAKEDVMQGAVANLIQGEPVRVGEMLETAGHNDPRIAESFEAEPIVSDAEVSNTLYGRNKSRNGEAQSLLQFIRSLGGLKPDPELNSVFGRNKLDLVRNDGMSLDQAREAAVEAGYLHDTADQGVTESTIQHLLDAMSQEERGDKVYPAGEQSPKITDHERDRIEGEITAGFQELGQDAKSVPKKIRDRTAHIMYTEGVEDPIAAYERAVMEEDYYAEKTGSIQRIEGNQLPAESRTAQGPSGTDQGVGGLRGASPAARQSGGNDRSASDAEWQRLARKPDNDAAIEKSQAAAKVPEPFSTIATKSREAAEMAAAEIEERFKAMAEGGLLPEEAKTQIDEILLKAKQYEVDWASAVKNGISCLAIGAAGSAV